MEIKEKKCKDCSCKNAKCSEKEPMISKHAQELFKRIDEKSLREKDKTR